MDKNKLNRLVNSVKRAVEAEQLAGIDEIICKNWNSPPVAGLKSSVGLSPFLEKRTLEELRKIVLSCKRCPLYKTNTHYVFGEGSKQAKLMFIGEAPGREEDLQGRPFVGRAGELLTKIIESIGLRRQDVFIANVLKCRPPENRNPLPTEIAACSPYLIEQISLIKPKIICALGKFAAQTLLATETPISRLRGSFFEYQGIKLMPTYHPAYLLRNPQDKKYVWKDMQVVAKELGIEIRRGSNKSSN